MIHFTQLRRYLPRLDEAWLQPLDEQARDYVQYYGIDFDRRVEGLTQSIGRFDSGDFELVGQCFILDVEAPSCYVVHGYYDHAGLYKHLIEWCLGRGYNVVLFDLPGHGLSSGHAASIDDFDCYIAALNKLLLWSATRLTGKKILFGQSTGSAAIMSYLLSRPHNIDRTVLMAPLVRPHMWSSMRWLHKLAKRFTSTLRRTFTMNSHDAEFLDFLHRRDPLQCRQQPVRWVTSMSQWIPWFLAQPETRLRILVVQGTGDYTVDWRYNLSVIRRKFPLARIVQVEGMRHHVVCESEFYREQVFSEVQRYLQDY
ncbi:alpha-beta hydrolase superfamily lysophospholipase [Sinobacterium caligoides]|uniref:Alpha-beta hydrolase superfamily lysophospholipase n=1 Tax=Sinobacterium caligoides TaxID=933926 RepID=A0A3N2DHN8_9GAMM|nr:alpha/beta hydrolase [Sinobacterium caligoides]ROR98904.1 alpha-beta hydrolase superfamily lysophospholipase [Sinobacterium caligoides]